jgi:hypothetical protein
MAFFKLSNLCSPHVSNTVYPQNNCLLCIIYGCRRETRGFI